MKHVKKCHWHWLVGGVVLCSVQIYITLSCRPWYITAMGVSNLNFNETRGYNIQLQSMNVLRSIRASTINNNVLLTKFHSFSSHLVRSNLVSVWVCAPFSLNLFSSILVITIIFRFIVNDILYRIHNFQFSYLKF